MRAVLQRVSEAGVSVEGITIGEIQQGLLVLLGIHESDSEDQVKWLASKVINLRIFEDLQGKMNHSLLEQGGEMLIVSQFTLYGKCEKGRRPGFSSAARPEISIPLYEKFIEEVKKLGVVKVATGEFGADMQVSLTNDGPVTLIIDTPKEKKC
ncbi:MAG: D-aminoacyl-tRNA deacylase [Fusobacteria bacterium]|nr:D-aminoacyl-tRNA deacylase [Fusobacteriota bacterium]